MSTDAVNDQGALVYVYPELTVLANPDSSGVPGLADVFEGVYCTRVVQSAGGARLDYADLEWALSENLTDRDQPNRFQMVVAVDMPDATGTRIHLADYVRESYRIDRDGEYLTAQSQLRPYHFGIPLKGYDVLNALSGLQDVIMEDVVFNPSVDDRTLFNMSDAIRNGGVGKLWLHPECCLTDVSEVFQGQAVTEWTLVRAVQSLMELLNEDEEFIRNPTFADMDEVVTTPPALRDVRIPIGTRLNNALDIVLIPNGYNWFVDYDTGTEKPIIKLFQIGAGTHRELKFQAPGESLNLEWSNVNQLSVDSAIGDSFNRVRVYGEREEAEVTLPLYPAWAAADDTMPREDVQKDAVTYWNKETVHRLWVANESGDLPTGTRWSIPQPVPDLTSIFDSYIPHRRTIGEPLTYAGGTTSRQRRPVLVEYSIDAGASWESCPDEWGVKLAPDQIGVLFDAKDAPEELIDAGTSARVRITGTVFGDARIEALAVRQFHAVNGRDFEQVINAPDKFMKRWVVETGLYASVLATSAYGDNTADLRDDSTEIEDYAEAIRDQNHHAEIDCEFRLPGWHLEYQIGDLIKKVQGRELSLDAASAESPAPRYVQIVERRFENSSKGGPSTVLIVDRGIDENTVNRLVARSEAKQAVRAGKTPGV